MRNFFIFYIILTTIQGWSQSACDNAISLPSDVSFTDTIFQTSQPICGLSKYKLYSYYSQSGFSVRIDNFSPGTDFDIIVYDDNCTCNPAITGSITNTSADEISVCNSGTFKILVKLKSGSSGSFRLTASSSYIGTDVWALPGYTGLCNEAFNPKECNFAFSGTLKYGNPTPNCFWCSYQNITDYFSENEPNNEFFDYTLTDDVFPISNQSGKLSVNFTGNATLFLMRKDFNDGSINCEKVFSTSFSDYSFDYSANNNFQYFLIVDGKGSTEIDYSINISYSSCCHMDCSALPIDYIHFTLPCGESCMTIEESQLPAPTLSENCTGYTITRTIDPPLLNNQFCEGIYNICYNLYEPIYTLNEDNTGQMPPPPVQTCCYKIVIDSPPPLHFDCNISDIEETVCHGSCYYLDPQSIPKPNVEGCDYGVTFSTQGLSPSNCYYPGTHRICYYLKIGGIPIDSCCININVYEQPIPELICPSIPIVTAPPRDCQARVTYQLPEVDMSCCPNAVVMQTSGLPPGSLFPPGMTDLCFEVSCQGEKKTCCTTVTVNPGLITPRDSVVNTICTDNNGSLTVTNPIGSPYQYKLNSNGAWQASPTFLNLNSGQYILYIRNHDQGDCVVGEKTVNIEHIPGPGGLNVESTENSGCDGQSGSITATITGTQGTKPYIFTIIGSTINESKTLDINNCTFPGLPAGSYLISVKDKNGCEHTESATIKEGNGPTHVEVTAIPPSCNKADGIIKLEIIGGTPDFKIYMNGVEQPKIIDHSTILNNLPPNEYHFLLIDANGCEISDSITLPPAPIITSITTDVEEPTCETIAGNDGAITVNITGGTQPYRYQASGQQMASSPNKSYRFDNLTGGEYVLTVRDINGCDATTTIELPIRFKPVIKIIEVEQPSCTTAITGKIMITKPNDGYAYTFSLNGIDFSEDSVFEKLVPEEYYPLIRNESTGCLSDNGSATIIPLERNFKAVTDTIDFNFQSSPLRMDVIKNDDTSRAGVYSTWALYEDVEQNGKFIGTAQKDLFDEGDPSRQYNINFYFRPKNKEVSLEYPDDPLVTFYVLYCDQCPVAPDTGMIIIRNTYDCFGNEANFVNVITPNGDGLNDVLVIPDFPKCNIVKSKIQIFNRWGKAVYSRDKYENNWNGVSDDGTPLPAGTYYYVLIYRNDKEKEYVIKNFVEIVR